MLERFLIREYRASKKSKSDELGIDRSSYLEKKRKYLRFHSLRKKTDLTD